MPRFDASESAVSRGPASGSAGGRVLPPLEGLIGEVTAFAAGAWNHRGYTLWLVHDGVSLRDVVQPSWRTDGEGRGRGGATMEWRRSSCATFMLGAEGGTDSFRYVTTCRGSSQPGIIRTIVLLLIIPNTLLLVVVRVGVRSTILSKLHGARNRAVSTSAFASNQRSTLLATRHRPSEVPPASALDAMRCDAAQALHRRYTCGRGSWVHPFWGRATACKKGTRTGPGRPQAPLLDCCQASTVRSVADRHAEEGTIL
jgi:hypothetical protein